MKFKYFINQLRQVIHWYDEHTIDRNSYKIGFSNGDSISMKYDLDCIPYMLGINIDYLIDSGFYKGSPYQICLDIVDNPSNFYYLIRFGYLDFNKVIGNLSKLNNYKEIFSFNKKNVLGVVKTFKRDEYLFVEKTNNDVVVKRVVKIGKDYLPVFSVVLDTLNNYDNSIKFLNKITRGNEVLGLVSCIKEEKEDEIVLSNDINIGMPKKEKDSLYSERIYQYEMMFRKTFNKVLRKRIR